MNGWTHFSLWRLLFTCKAVESAQTPLSVISFSLRLQEVRRQEKGKCFKKCLWTHLNLNNSIQAEDSKIKEHYSLWSNTTWYGHSFVSHKWWALIRVVIMRQWSTQPSMLVYNANCNNPPSFWMQISLLANNLISISQELPRTRDTWGISKSIMRQNQL